jgi:heat-inducible transcriptional repressor
MSELQYRARSILYAAITEFISTGEPVGSRTLAKKYGLDLSSASIRNVLSDLEEGGYLHQPHTSAGRIPTDKAFRLFIDTLMQVRPLSVEEREHIVERFYALAPGVEWTRESGRLLSELTRTAVVIAPKRETRALTQLRFIPTRPGEILAVVVLADGTVENRFIRIEKPLSETELLVVHNLLADVIEGRSLGEVREPLRAASRTTECRSIRSATGRSSLGQLAIGDLGQRQGLVIEGEASVSSSTRSSPTWTACASSSMHSTSGRPSFPLLDRTIEAKDVQIFRRSEAGDPLGGHLSRRRRCALYRSGRVAGTIGVLGPTRMDYPKVVPLVEATADAMSAYASARARRWRRVIYDKE